MVADRSHDSNRDAVDDAATKRHPATELQSNVCCPEQSKVVRHQATGLSDLLCGWTRLAQRRAPPAWHKQRGSPRHQIRHWWMPPSAHPRFITEPGGASSLAFCRPPCGQPAVVISLQTQMCQVEVPGPVPRVLRVARSITGCCALFLDATRHWLSAIELLPPPPCTFFCATLLKEYLNQH